jgi:hypothetical protein
MARVARIVFGGRRAQDRPGNDAGVEQTKGLRKWNVITTVDLPKLGQPLSMQAGPPRWVPREIAGRSAMRNSSSASGSESTMGAPLSRFCRAQIFSPNSKH